MAKHYLIMKYVEILKQLFQQFLHVAHHLKSSVKAKHYNSVALELQCNNSIFQPKGIICTTVLSGHQNSTFNKV